MGAYSVLVLIRGGAYMKIMCLRWELIRGRRLFESGYQNPAISKYSVNLLSIQIKMFEYVNHFMKEASC